jgi:hypothetical protein
MEKIKHTKTARLRSLKMYRAELDHLVEQFQKSCTSVVISDENHRFNNLDEMKQHTGPRIRNIDIRGEKPGLHFLLNQKEFAPGSTTPAIFNELRTEELSPEAEALFFKLREFLQAYQRPTNTRFLVPAIAGLAGAFALTARGIASAVEGRGFHITPAIVILIAFTIVCVILGIANSQNQLSLETRLNSPSFWARNRDDFAKQAITSLISGLLGWLVGHFMK